jgi:S-DNA-T family DNA segregation ATPase FtsK/SpoIIIE
VLRDGRDRGHAVVLAGTTEELAASFRGFAADARRSRSGLLLSPASHLDGELLGLRLLRSAAFSGPPGRGLLVRGGKALLVQVPLPG